MIGNYRNNTGSGIDTDFDLWVLLDQTRFVISRARELELAHFGLTVIRGSVLFTLQSLGGGGNTK